MEVYVVFMELILHLVVDFGHVYISAEEGLALATMQVHSAWLKRGCRN